MGKKCFLCDSDTFEEISVVEKVKVKDLEMKVKHNYIRCTECEETFSNFDNPNENLIRDYDEYRKKKQWLMPEEIRKIRKRYELSQKEYASLLGISYSTLSAIENGSLQSKAHESQFVLSKSAHGMKLLVVENKNIFTPQKFSDILRMLDDLIILDNEELEKRFVIIEDEVQQLIMQMNVLKYDVSEISRKREKPQLQMFKTIKEKVNGNQPLFVHRY